MISRWEPDQGSSLPRRLFLAFCGIITGDIALALVLLWNSAPLGMLAFYMLFSLAGWVIVGLPVALGVPPHFIGRMSWYWRILVGGALGPLALFLIFVLLFAAQGTLNKFSLDHTGGLWQLSVLTSATAFVVYAKLLDKDTARL